MNRSDSKKGRLRMMLIAAAALGSSSATLSGALTVLSLQHSPPPASGNVLA
ncbi:MAG: hypothetical protein ACK40O_03070 [Allosphingosinicella sp.]